MHAKAKSIWARCYGRVQLITFTYLRAVEGGTDLGGTEGKAHVAGVGGGDGVHGQTTSLVGGGGEGGLGVNIDGGAHLDGGGGLLFSSVRCVSYPIEKWHVMCREGFRRERKEVVSTNVSSGVVGTILPK